jgi:integrase
MAKISENVVKDLPVPKTGNKVHFFSKAKLQGKEAPSGFGVRVTAAGGKSFVLFQRVNGKKFLHTLRAEDGHELSVIEAIIEARKLSEKLKAPSVDPRPDRTQKLKVVVPVAKPIEKTVTWLLDNYIADQRAKPEQERLRSIDKIAATFERHVKPAIGGVEIYAIERSHIKDMLAKIATETDDWKGAPVMADQTLAYIRAAFNWYAPDDDKFRSPIVKNMAKTDPVARRRKRTLNEQEIRDLWAALDIIQDVPACYPHFVKTLLFTGTRRSEAAGMHSTELDGDDVWLIPAARAKNGLDHAVPLSAAARDVIARAPSPAERRNARFIFSSTEGEKAFSGYSKCKRRLDKAIAKIREAGGRDPMLNWTLHDLRRTARSMLSRAVMELKTPDGRTTMIKVGPDIAERCIGHVIGGIRGNYDWHDYLPEKTAAFAALADMIGAIVHPPEGNVTNLRRA